MEEILKKTRRIFTPQQKYEMIKDIERHPTLREGLKQYTLQYSVYRRWRRQLQVGLNASLRNGRPVKSQDLKRLERENRTLKEALLTQSLLIAEIKKEMGLDAPLPGESDWYRPSGKSSSPSLRSNGR